jgi:hypothetical protein
VTIVTGTVPADRSYRWGMTTVSRGTRRRLGVGLLAATLALAIVPISTIDAASKPYTLDLGKRADFVAQTNFVQCVGASVQMMLNIIEPGRDRTAKTQKRLQKLARSWSGPTPSGFERQGASVSGWAATLNIKGGGPYRVVGARSLSMILRVAAKAMRETGRPVGLLMWHGRHAWVMSGFRATADPARTDAFRVTGVIVEDPLYPHGSSVWGPSPRPGAMLTVARLGKQFVPRRSRSPWASANPSMRRFAGMYVVVLPYHATATGWAKWGQVPRR